LVALSAVFPRPLLWLIGAKYANLESEVWLMMLNAALGSLLLCLVSLTYFKGWIIPAAILIPLEIATQLILILSFDMSTVRGVLMVGVIATVPPILLNMVIAHLKTRNSPIVS